MFWPSFFGAFSAMVVFIGLWALFDYVLDKYL